MLLFNCPIDINVSIENLFWFLNFVNNQLQIVHQNQEDLDSNDNKSESDKIVRLQ